MKRYTLLIASTFPDYYCDDCVGECDVIDGEVSA